MKIDATFVRSAARADDFPWDGAPEVALVGRSNVGKSSLINALVGSSIARTSAAPGKTRLANIYRLVRRSDRPFYVVDLPGYGYARGGAAAARGFDEMTRGVFGRERQEGVPADIAALFLVDSRHPGLQNDIEAWHWLQSTVERCAVVATKIDKLSRAERRRAIQQVEAVFEHPALPVSAATGEGLDELWILIDKLATSSNQRRSNNRRRSSHSRL